MSKIGFCNTLCCIKDSKTFNSLSLIARAVGSFIRLSARAVEWHSYCFVAIPFAHAPLKITTTSALVPFVLFSG